VLFGKRANKIKESNLRSLVILYSAVALSSCGSSESDKLSPSLGSLEGTWSDLEGGGGCSQSVEELDQRPNADFTVWRFSSKFMDAIIPTISSNCKSIIRYSILKLTADRIDFKTSSYFYEGSACESSDARSYDGKAKYFNYRFISSNYLVFYNQGENGLVSCKNYRRN